MNNGTPTPSGAEPLNLPPAMLHALMTLLLAGRSAAPAPAHEADEVNYFSQEELEMARAHRAGAQPKAEAPAAAAANAEAATPDTLLPCLQVVDGQPTCLSTDVARHFEKRHDHVLRDIRNLLPQLGNEHLPNFGEVITEFQNGNGGTQKAPAYRLTRDGFTLLAMGFTGKKALAFKLAYIAAFNRMEAELARQAAEAAEAAATPSQALAPELHMLLTLFAPLLAELTPHVKDWVAAWLDQRTRAMLPRTTPPYMDAAWFDLLNAHTKLRGRANVARELGVSPPQVSQVLNGSGKYGTGQASPQTLADKVLGQFAVAPMPAAQAQAQASLI